MLVGDQIEKGRFEDLNLSLVDEGKRPVIAEPMLLGITKASLATESFISAASFQETTKVLTEAAFYGWTDHPARPQGERHHGRLIPAGTGLVGYLGVEIDVPGVTEQAEDDLTQALQL